MKFPFAPLLVTVSFLVACGEAPLPAAAPTAPAPARDQARDQAREVKPPEGKGSVKKLHEYDYDAVCPNPDKKLPPAFQGDVHPALHGVTTLELVAEWKPTLDESKRKNIRLGIIDNESAPEYSIPGPLVRLLTETKPAAERASYGAHELSAFLPEKLEEVGQMWALDPERAALPLKQFHPAVSVTFDNYHQPYGRRPGPAGAYGILRAISDEYFDIAFRVHAEFNLRDGQAIYTPACFLGRMLVDRKTGTVPFFEMSVPTERSVNLDILLTFRIHDDPTKVVTNIVFERVEPMDLRAGDRELPAHIAWSESLDLAEAEAQLKGAFYKFLDIGWVPLEEVIEKAEKIQKPILVAVLTSPLDDQSC